MANLRNNNITAYHALPIQVEWEGWRADTFSLNRRGWEINASEHYDMYQNEKIITIGAVDPEKKIFLRGRFNVPSLSSMMGYNHEEKMLLNMVVPMGVYTIKDTVMIRPEPDMSSMRMMRPVDLYSTTEYSPRSVSMRDFDFFKYAPSQEIYIPPESVSECLDRILQLQYPEQMEIKKKLILPESKPLITARILTLAA